MNLDGAASVSYKVATSTADVASLGADHWVLPAQTGASRVHDAPSDAFYVSVVSAGTPDEIRIQHVFRDPVSGFTDAIVLPKDAYEALSEAEIDALKAERVSAWKAALAEAKDAPAPDPVEVAEALEAEKAALVERLSVVEAELLVRVAEVDAKVVKGGAVEAVVEDA